MKFLKYVLLWVSSNLSIPFWVVGHIHLTINIYEDIYEILASFGMNIVVFIGFWISWVDHKNKKIQKRIKNIMSEDRIPYLRSDMNDDKMNLWDNTLMDGLKEIKVEEVIDKVRNYYNTCCDIDGRPPSKIEFNEFLDLL